MAEFLLNNLPKEVQEVWMFQYYIHYCGSEAMDRIQAIIKKYPEYFPWETIYARIPQSVHDAYYKERNRLWETEWKLEGNEGIIGRLDKHANLTMPSKSEMTLGEIIKEMLENERKERKRQKEDKKKATKLWDKYYKKYSLKYRGK